MLKRIPTAARSWASRLLLLLACASVVATSRIRSRDELSPVLTGTPVRLTMDSTKVMRTLVVRADAKEGSSVPAVGNLRLLANAKWTPSTPTQTAQPRLSINAYDGQTDRGGTSEVLKPAVTVKLRSVTGLGRECPLNSGCAWTAQVAFELKDREVPGTVDVEWKAMAAVHVEGTNDLPEGFTVSMSEP
ncbi:hypothetical protein KH5H1_56690 [Corallococcus caeni]|uniref:hypothetical protein n=1 Tax=Corallococcus caeni TaxID=3082388 RepID=UPI0029572400|nr:hypothetical protein KH5H1_56690 [Corallococcus sp. KH5-1]